MLTKEFEIIQVNNKDVKVLFSNYNNFDEIIEIINNYLPKIGGTVLESNLEKIKRSLKTILTRFDFSKRIGAVAELCVHALLNYLGYEMYSCFFNLEETGSVKKGFDGVYSNNDYVWILESKSTSQINLKHKKMIKKASDDLNNKISLKYGDDENDVWRNAFNHYALCVNKNEKVLDFIKNGIKNYENDGNDPKYFNVIPASTLYFLENQTHEEVLCDLKELLINYNFNDMVVLCINNTIFNDIVDYYTR